MTILKTPLGERTQPKLPLITMERNVVTPILIHFPKIVPEDVVTTIDNPRVEEKGLFLRHLTVSEG